MVLVYLS